MSILLILGAGNMGGAFYRGLTEAGSGERVAVSDTNEEKLRELGAEMSSIDANMLLPEADAVLFAVKPQAFAACVDGITHPLQEKLVLSIMAGISIENIRQKTGADRIIRAMPNLAATVGESLTGWIATKACTPEDKARARAIFDAVGQTVELEDEKLIDAITPLSGSGPAYFFLLTEMLQKQAEQWGFSEEQAQALAEQTFIGAAHLLIRNDRTAEEWRHAVTSKGGVTEAALASLQDARLQEIFSQALERAKQRNDELG